MEYKMKGSEFYGKGNSPMKQKLSTTEKLKAGANAVSSGLPGIKDGSTIFSKYINEKKKIRKKKRVAKDKKKNPENYRYD